MAPGVWWIRMPLPFALDHINLWILADGDGFTLVDTGYGVQATWDLWEQHFAGVMGGRAGEERRRHALSPGSRGQRRHGSWSAPARRCG